MKRNEAIIVYNAVEWIQYLLVQRKGILQVNLIFVWDVGKNLDEFTIQTLTLVKEHYLFSYIVTNT